MSTAHRIHLQGPWLYQLLDPVVEEQTRQADAELPIAEGRVKLPATWGECFGDYRGTVRYQRHFNCPTNLDARESVFVIFTEIGGLAAAHLNGSSLGNVGGGPGPFEFEIKSLLLPRNLLVVDVIFSENDEPPGGLWSPVALEIRVL